MADGDIFLVSKTGDAINLNPLLTSDEGVQAVAGLTGFGLPPVEVLYQTGAGDGARFRGQRFLPRDIDMPLFITSTTRDGLRTQVARLTAALADECRLQWDDGDRVWELKVRRVGGGEYILGQDNNLHSLSLAITFRAESSVWTAVTGSTITQALTTSTATKITIPANTFGTAASKPTIKVKGPTLGFTIENGTRDKKLIYRGFIRKGDFIEVDFEKGTATNSDGMNAYALIAEAPSFFTIGPAADSVWITLDRASQTYVEIAGTPIGYNYITNPTFETDALGWSLSAPSYVEPASAAIAWNSGSKSIVFPGMIATNVPNAGVHTTPIGVMSYTFPDGTFVIGQRYSIHVTLTMMPSWLETMPTENVPGRVTMTMADEIRRVEFVPNGSVERNIRLDFVARNSGGTLYVSAPVQAVAGSAVRQHLTNIQRVSVVDYELPDFDGDSPDLPHRVYEWTGPAHASISRARAVTSTGDAEISLTHNAKNWVVI